MIQAGRGDLSQTSVCGARPAALARGRGVFGAGGSSVSPSRACQAAGAAGICPAPAAAAGTERPQEPGCRVPPGTHRARGSRLQRPGAERSPRGSQPRCAGLPPAPRAEGRCSGGHVTGEGGWFAGVTAPGIWIPPGHNPPAAAGGWRLPGQDRPIPPPPFGLRHQRNFLLPLPGPGPCSSRDSAPVCPCQGPAMEPVASRPGCSACWLPCLLLLALHGCPGAGAQEFQLLQPQGNVSVSAGETLTLSCSVTGLAPVGPVKWFKGSGSGRQLVYEDKEPHTPRVTRAVSGSDTDFTIRISDTRPEDAGIYHCVKFRKVSGGDEEIRSGAGTAVTVRARPSVPSVSGPPSRAEPGPLVNFTCTSGGFSPRDIAVTWLKNGAKLTDPQTQVLPAHENVSYSVSSTVGVSLTAGDARSQLSCQIEHSTLPAPLCATYNLSAALRVPPRLRVGTAPAAPVALNESVTFTCRAEGFYPKDANLTWLENGNETNLGKSPSLAENPNGTYTLQSSLEVKATEQRNQSVFTCRVVHDSQPPVNASAMLRISQPPPEPGKDSTADSYLSEVKNIYIAVAVVCAVLVVLVIAVIYLIRARQRKGKSSPSVRLHEPEKSPSTAPQDSDPNNLTYADLNFDNRKKRRSPPRLVEMSPQSEYACIQPTATENNLTYADLDMVHLSKSPKRPAPRPEEAVSEYASVQIQRK